MGGACRDSKFEQNNMVIYEVIVFTMRGKDKYKIFEWRQT